MSAFVITLKPILYYSYTNLRVITIRSNEILCFAHQYA